MYLIGLCIITLLAFVVSPTYAKFVDTYVTDDDIVEMDLSFNIGITGIDEYHEVSVSAGESLKFNVEVENASSEMLYYGVWYKMVSPSELPTDESIQIGKLDGSEISTTGSVDGSSSKTVTVGIINGSDSKIKIYIGVASSLTGTTDIEYLNGKQLITGTVIVQTEMFLSDYVINKYNDGSAITTVNIGGSTDNPQVHLNATQGIMLDNNGDYRYYGADPDNYVLYNDELWRIISVGNVKSSATDTVGETRVKIVKADILEDDNDLSAYSYDSSASTINSGYGVNDWSKSDLMTELNTLYLNSTSGTCYTGQSNASTACNFTNTGLSAEARSLTADALYYLGGSSSSSGLYADDYYTFERGTTVYGCSTDDGACPRATTWSGRVGIIYPSDYAYATDLSLCTSDPYNYEGDDNCYGKDWLLYSGNDLWTISPNSSNAYDAFRVYSAGYVYGNGYVYRARAVRPVQYLRSEVTIVEGEGTTEKPYILGT